jgi:hypothetical protein
MTHLCKHKIPYCMCEICQMEDMKWQRKWEEEYRKFDESNENAREEENNGTE